MSTFSKATETTTSFDAFELLSRSTENRKEKKNFFLFFFCLSEKKKNVELFSILPKREKISSIRVFEASRSTFSTIKVRATLSIGAFPVDLIDDEDEELFLERLENSMRSDGESFRLGFFRLVLGSSCRKYLKHREKFSIERENR